MLFGGKKYYASREKKQGVENVLQLNMVTFMRGSVTKESVVR